MNISNDESLKISLLFQCGQVLNIQALEFPVQFLTRIIKQIPYVTLFADFPSDSAEPATDPSGQIPHHAPRKGGAGYLFY